MIYDRYKFQEVAGPTVVEILSYLAVPVIFLWIFCMVAVQIPRLMWSSIVAYCNTAPYPPIKSTRRE